MFENTFSLEEITKSSWYSFQWFEPVYDPVKKQLMDIFNSCFKSEIFRNYLEKARFTGYLRIYEKTKQHSKDQYLSNHVWMSATVELAKLYLIKRR